MVSKADYHAKFCKYKTKYAALQKAFYDMLEDGSIIQQGGSEDSDNPDVRIPSIYAGTILVYRPTQTRPAIMRYEHDDTYLQTVYDPKYPERIYLKYICVLLSSLQYTEPRSVLMVGLGGGHIPTILRRRFPDSRIDIVDIDPSALTAALMMGFKQDPMMRITIEDGRTFIDRPNIGPYDIIFLDLDGSDVTMSFDMERLRSLLNPKGVLGINMARSSDNNEYQYLQSIFNCVKVHNIPQSIYICSNDSDCSAFNRPITLNNASIALRRLDCINDIIDTVNK